MSVPNLKIWHRVKHDDFTVTEIATDLKGGYFGTIKKIVRDGGFWNYAKKYWVPYHCITHIAPVEEE